MRQSNQSHGLLKLLGILGAGYLIAGIVQGVSKQEQKPVSPSLPVFRVPGPQLPPAQSGGGGGPGDGIPSLGEVSAAIGSGAAALWDAFSNMINGNTSNLTYNSPIYVSPSYPAGASDKVTAPQPAYPVLNIPGVTILPTTSGPKSDAELVAWFAPGGPGYTGPVPISEVLVSSDGGYEVEMFSGGQVSGNPEEIAAESYDWMNEMPFDWNG